MIHRLTWQKRLHRIIFGTDTPAGRWFDLALLVAILVSVLAVALESVASLRMKYGSWLRIAEWTITILFTVEYVLRIATVPSKRKYIFSFFGLVDLLAILPTYLSLIISGSQMLMVVRALRLLRIFRILKLVRFVGEANALLIALRNSRDKIIIFLMVIVTLTLIMGTAMYMIEGEKSGFTSIPRSMYWAIVTMTTVGYGDISPQTVPGQMLASFMMVVGYAIIVVPTGIFSVELARAATPTAPTLLCPHCQRDIRKKPEQD